MMRDGALEFERYIGAGGGPEENQKAFRYIYSALFDEKSAGGKPPASVGRSRPAGCTAACGGDTYGL
jgi:hypothetical protein